MNFVLDSDAINRERTFKDEIGYLIKDVILRQRSQEPKKADAYLDRFNDFDIERLRNMTRKALKAILLDVDGCIAPPCGEILRENVIKIKELLDRGIKIGVYSNCENLSRMDLLRKMGIDIYNGREPKPESRGFKGACEFFGFNPEETWMVGDNPLTDGGAIGVLEGTAFIKPISERWKDLPKNKRISFYFKKIFRYLAMRAILRNSPKIITTKKLQSFDIKCQTLGTSTTTEVRKWARWPL